MDDPQSSAMVPNIELTVVSGPDAGHTLSFGKSRITVGRGPDNDVVLSDGFVSSCHGAFVVTERGKVRFEDLQSRHGSLVVVDNVSHRLQEGGREASEPIDVGEDCEVQVGCTLIKLQVREPQDTTTKIELPDSKPKLESKRAGESVNRANRRSNDKVITQALEPVRSLNRRIENDHERLAVLFRLAGELNGRTALGEILDLVVDATFDAFPNANFFAITLASEPEEVGVEKPFFTRVRGDLPGVDGEEPILSTSILEHVVESQESVLFLKDSIGAELTESILEAEITSCLCAPLVGQKSLLGVMEVDTRGQGGVFSRRDLDLFSVLASNVAFAIERAELSSNIVEMFESFVAASVDAIEARDPTTAGHSQRVTRYTIELARAVNQVDTGPLADFHLDREELKELRYAALLHDFGKIAVEEAVLQKAKRLPQTRLELIAQRFETIKGLTYRRRIAEQVDEAEGALSAGTLQAVEADHATCCRELDEAVEKIRRMAGAPSLTDEEIEWARSFGERTYRDADGRERPFLTEEEVQGLSIQYGTLDDEEWEQVQSHPAHSERFLERIPWSDELRRIPSIAGAHHEKLDGSGYPGGMGSEEIIPQVRMLTIADIFDALTASDRPYREAFSIEKAMDILWEEADAGKLDEDFLTVFSEHVLPRIRQMVPQREEPALEEAESADSVLESDIEKSYEEL